MTDKPEAIEAEIVPVPKLTLSQKIADIQNSVGVVKKRGKYGSQGGGGGNWEYLRIEDAVVAVNKLMSDRGLILTGTLQKKPGGEFYFEQSDHLNKEDKRSGYISKVVFQWTLEDIASGESRSWDFPGEGYDSTDKGIYKAMTGSRKYAITIIFNLPIGNDVEERGAVTYEEAKNKAKNVASSKIADAAGRGVPAAVDAMSQIEVEKKIIIKRPEEHNGNYIAVFGYLAVPQLERFFDDTGSKRFKNKTDAAYWRVPSEYERGLLALCERLEIEVQG